MAGRINRHVIEERDPSIYNRAAIQAIRQAGDGIPAHASAEWGNITGVIDNQADLKQRTDDIEAAAMLEDD